MVENKNIKNGDIFIVEEGRFFLKVKIKINYMYFKCILLLFCVRGSFFCVINNFFLLFVFDRGLFVLIYGK